MPKKKSIEPNTVVEMKLTELHPFKNHPFKVLDDELMQQTIDSISQVGVLSPAVVRPDPDGGYEIISGHRRMHACEAAGLETMPVIVKDLTDDEAVIFMVDSNLQRENILPSERALAYLTQEEQQGFLDAMDYSQNTPSLSQAQRIRKLSQNGTCTVEAMREIMSEEKKSELKKSP